MTARPTQAAAQSPLRAQAREDKSEQDRRISNLDCAISRTMVLDLDLVL